MAQLMRAVRRFHYPTGHPRRPGDVFQVKGRHAEQLSLAGLAVVVKPVLPQSYTTRHMEAKPVSAMTVTELRDAADKKGIILPKGYITKADLVGLVERG